MSASKPQDKGSKEEHSGENAPLDAPPLSDLKESVDQLTEWCAPLLTNEERATTRAALNQLQKNGGLGFDLHKALAARNQPETDRHWLDDYWASRTLGQRQPLPLANNYFLLFRHMETDRRSRAGALIAAALNYKLVIDQNILPEPSRSSLLAHCPERDKQPCTAQLTRLFGTTRLPGEQQDRLRHTLEEDDEAGRHIVVFYRGNIFCLQVIADNGTPHALKDIVKGIEQIEEEGLDRQTQGRSLGYLTCLMRADWSKTRARLIASSHDNAVNLDLIETALFSVHLEDDMPANDQEAGDHILLGDSGNRWHDKSLQFVVFNNGVAGLSVERSVIDRTAILDFLDYALDVDPLSLDRYSGALEQGLPNCRRLAFALSASLQKKISLASEDFEAQRTALITSQLKFTGFGARALTDLEVCPQTFLQCALQIAYLRSNDSCSNVTAEISWHHFKRGRTQNIWTLTPELLDFANNYHRLTWNDEDAGTPLAPPEDRKKVLKTELKRAMQTIEDRIQASHDGLAPELHIDALHEVYRNNPQNFLSSYLSRLLGSGHSQKDINKGLSLYTTPGWIKMHRNIVQTSALSSPFIIHQGSGPLDEQNITAGCIVQPDALDAYLTASRNQYPELPQLADHWRQALLELGQLLTIDAQA